jgi:amino acid transporter
MVLCLICGIIGLLSVFIIRLVSSTLVLSEYSKGLPTQVGLHYILDNIVSVLFVCSIVFLLITLVLFFINRNSKNKKKLYVVPVLLLVVAFISTVFVGLASYANIERYECYKNLFNDLVEEKSNEVIPTQDRKLFPFLEPIQETYGDDAYYSLTKVKTPNALYVHAQNLSLFLSDEVVFNLEYISSDERNILAQFKQQKNPPRIYLDDEQPLVLDKEEYNSNGKIYNVYKYDYYYEMRIYDSDSCFSVVFSRLDDFNEEMKYDYEELALSLYNYLDEGYKTEDGSVS